MSTVRWRELGGWKGEMGAEWRIGEVQVELLGVWGHSGEGMVWDGGGVLGGAAGVEVFIVWLVGGVLIYWSIDV